MVVEQIPIHGVLVIPAGMLTFFPSELMLTPVRGKQKKIESNAISKWPQIMPPTGFKLIIVVRFARKKDQPVVCCSEKT